MPELAEVEFFRKRWQSAARGQITAVRVQERAKVFRGTDAAALARALPGRSLLGSQANGKQMLFRFGERRAGEARLRKTEAWLGIHLGMTGELRIEPPGFSPGRHDHLALFSKTNTLVFSDPRTFGRVRFDIAPPPAGDAPFRRVSEPEWWRRLAPAVLSPRFTVAALAAFLRRRSRAPIKAVLLMQERFPGVGNWMADEILWRAGIHPRQRAGSLRPAEVRSLRRECRWVCRMALKIIAGTRLQGASTESFGHRKLPASWLMPHRWEDGGRCPRTGCRLERATIGGRTTCWSPARQKLHA